MPRSVRFQSSSGGTGPKKTPALAAKYANQCNLPFASVETFVKQRDRVAGAAETIGRDPGTLTYSAAQIVCVGSTEAEFAQRARAIRRQPDEVRLGAMAETVEQAAATIRRWNGAGATRMYLQMVDLSDLHHLDLIAAAITPLIG